MRMTRREWFALGGLVLTEACARKKRMGYPGYALIATSGDNSLAVVDLNAFRLLRPIPLGAAPTAVITGGPSNRAYVLTPSNGSVEMLDDTLNRVASQKLSDELSEIRLTPDGKTLLAIAEHGQQLIEADADSLKVRRRYALEAEPIGMDVVSDLIAFRAAPYTTVSTGDHGVVQLFDLQTGQRYRSQSLGRIGAVRFRGDGKLLVVANLQGRSLTALNIPDLQVVADLPLGMEPQNLCFTTDLGQLFVSGSGMDAIAIVFPYRILEVEQTVLAGRDPGVMACSGMPPQPTYLFVASNSGSDISILSVDTRKVVGIVEVGQKPGYITVTPNGQYALVLDERSGDMSVIPTATIHRSDAALNRYRAGASLFAVIPVGNNPMHAAIMPMV